MWEFEHFEFVETSGLIDWGEFDFFENFEKFKFWQNWFGILWFLELSENSGLIDVWGIGQIWILEILQKTKENFRNSGLIDLGNL